jgi:5-methylcytosine-specific restriction endonuclease McrA
MNWNNQGKYTGKYNETWQYDHIVPISSSMNEDDILRLNHYTNFQPLCSRKNLEKSDYIF